MRKLLTMIFVLSGAPHAFADGYVSWCIDHDVTKVKEVAVMNETEGCEVTLQEPYEGSEHKVTTYSGSDWETCFNKALELSRDIAEGYSCGAWSWAANVTISHKELMDGVLSTLQAYNETVRVWNESTRKYSHVALREIALIFPFDESRWEYDLDPSDLHLMATYGRYIEGFNWPQVFVKAMRADGYVTYDPEDPTANDTVLELGEVEDGACHGNEGKHLATVDYESNLIVHLLEGYDVCDGSYNRKVLQTEKYFLEALGEGIYEINKVD
ncbi:hypothetical protein GOE09_19975 [Sinorhizobium medicae]|nr:hypothetical protein [Sinorhizobium medicae]